jgi:selenocysteine-specific elongation factor
VLTKSDLADPEMLELAALEARELVSGSFLADAPRVAVSARTGEGLDQLRSVLTALAGGPGRPSAGVVRLPVDRVFSVKGFGTVVTGTLVSGTVRTDQDLVVLPDGGSVKVRGLQVHGCQQAIAGAGRRVAVNLAGVDVVDLSRGATLCERETFETSRRVDVKLELLGDARPLRHGARVRFHAGTSELLGRVAISSTGGVAHAVEPGGMAFARLRMEGPAVVTRGDRFILRAYSPPITIGGGIVIDPHPPRGGIRTPAGVDRLRSLDPAADVLDAVSVFVAERAGAGLPRQALVSRAGLTPDAARDAALRLAASRRVTAIGDLLVATAELSALEAKLLAAIDAHHKAQPLSDGLPREEARERLFGRAAPAVFEEVLRRLVEARRVVARDRLALAGHQLALSPDEMKAQEALVRVYKDAGFQPPDTAAAALTAGTSAETADRVLKLLLRSRALVKLDTLVFHPGTLERLKAEVRASKGENGGRVDVAAFKARYGITRKYAIPLLEYLDRERVTRRVGESRVVL